MEEIPRFAGEGGIALALARSLFVAALLAAFGTVLFAVAVAPRALARADAETAERARWRLLRLARAELAAALLAALVWLLAQAADMAGASSLAAATAAVPAVLAHTAFGHLLMAQAGALLATSPLLWRRPALGSARLRLAAALLGAAAAMQAGHGHAWAMYERPSPLLLAGVVHLLAAGGWLGGLVPLLLMVHGAPYRTGAAAARWYSPLGKWCVAGIAASSAWQFWQLIGGLPGLVGTAYGWVAGLKLALFGALFGFALANRYWLAPALMREAPERARRALVASIAVQTGFGLLVVLAAGVLSELPPAMHEQPIWPFPSRLSLDAVQEDADIRAEVIGAGVALAGAAALLVLAALARRPRLRWPALAVAAALAWFAVPHLRPLLADAYPTSFYRSPTGFAAASIAEGARLYPERCAACHGADGRGDGPAAAGLPVPPADLTAAHLWMHDDGEMFWWLTHGIEAPDGRPAMPGFAGVLAPDERWALIDYVRAHNAGVAMRATGRWPLPVQASGFEAACGDATTAVSGGFPGQVVRLVIGAAPRPAPLLAGTQAAFVAAGPAPEDGRTCAVADEAVSLAYATVSGIPPGELAGAQFLIDGDGWLRALQRPGTTAPSWDDPAALAAAIRDVHDHPLAPAAGHGMSMPMDMKM